MVGKQEEVGRSPVFAGSDHSGSAPSPVPGLGHSASVPNADDFLAWAMTKPADQAYDYCDPDHCAVAQYLRERGYADHPSVWSDFWEDRAVEPAARVVRQFPKEMARAANHTDMTFGGIVSRLSAKAGGEA